MTRILVIEDERKVRENIRELLISEGFEVLEAVDGLDGVQAARHQNPDIILCDIRMPHLDGYGVLARLSNDRLTEGIPFILLTARTERADQRMGMGLGADDYITKPFTRRDLLGSINKRLEKKQNLERLAERKFRQTGETIQHNLPLNLMEPVGMILGSAELLIENAQIASDPFQVRSIARAIRRTAEHLTLLVGCYSLYLELESALSNADRRADLLRQQCGVRQAQVAGILNDLARLAGREDDLSFSMQDAHLRMSERVFFSLLEALGDQIFRFTPVGVAIKINGYTSSNHYRLEIQTQGSWSPAAKLMAMKEETPLGLLLARRIVEVYGGTLSLSDSLDGSSHLVLELPQLSHESER
jgi:DNA-binding response OmpR family regulator